VNATRFLAWCCSMIAALGATPVLATDAATDWVEGYNSKSRLIAGKLAATGGIGLLAGVELALAPGWKTYWRMPGDSGGVPPHFDFAGSENLASATVLYPAPSRLTDPTGDAVGYKSAVVFPVEIVAADPSKPVNLTVQVEFGICREICVPAEARLNLIIPPVTAASPVAPALKAARDRVPARTASRRPQDPSIKSSQADLAGAKPTLSFAVAFPGGLGGADMFVEAPDGIYMPLPRKVGDDGKATATFEIDLTNGIDPKEIAGKVLTLTIVSDGGQVELDWPVPPS